MKILYIAVHGHVDWGAEHWMANAFERLGCTVERYDYRAQRKKKFKPWWLIRSELKRVAETFKPDAVLMQRGEKMPASVAQVFSVPRIFWSSEPLIRRRDHDALLNAQDTFSWIYVHTYTSLSIMEKEFAHNYPITSVMHPGAALENDPGDVNRPRFAVFNRNLSERRNAWLDEVSDLVDVISGRYGDPYFADLRESKIAVNIHFADSSVDDFETGIYEALASGCVVVTESLNPKPVADMGMQDALIQVGSPAEMRAALLALQNDPERVAHYQQRGRDAIAGNRWDARAQQILDKFREFA